MPRLAARRRRKGSGAALAAPRTRARRCTSRLAHMFHPLLRAPHLKLTRPSACCAESDALATSAQVSQNTSGVQMRATLAAVRSYSGVVAWQAEQNINISISGKPVTSGEQHSGIMGDNNRRANWQAAQHHGRKIRAGRWLLSTASLPPRGERLCAQLCASLAPLRASAALTSHACSFALKLRRQRSHNHRAASHAACAPHQITGTRIKAHIAAATRGSKCAPQSGAHRGGLPCLGAQKLSAGLKAAAALHSSLLALRPQRLAASRGEAGASLWRLCRLAAPQNISISALGCLAQRKRFSAHLRGTLVAARGVPRALSNNHHNKISSAWHAYRK